MASARDEVRVFLELTKQMAREQARLNLEKPAVADLVAEQRMRHFMARPALERGDEAPTPIPVERDAAGSGHKIARLDLPVVDDLDHTRVGDQGPERLHHIERERRA